MQDSSYRDKFWAFVTVFGTLWGGLELTLGTFLHTLRVPKTGFIMVSLSLILIIAQRRIFPARGSTLAAGIVAACIKSLSPGGIILGPVFGIVSEALFVELCFLTGARGIFPSICAGAVALFWSQLQSLFKMWLIYGKDFIVTLGRIVEKFLNIEWTASLGLGLLGIWAGVILVCGSLSGILGWHFGKRVEAGLKTARGELPDDLALAAEGQNLPSHDAPVNLNALPTKNTKTVRRSIDRSQILRTRGIVFPFALVTVVIEFIFSESLLYAGIALLVWLAVLAIFARNVLKAIWWPKFWGVTVAVCLVCGVVIATDLEGAFDVTLGLLATGRMMVRGLYVFSLINWMTRCIRTDECMEFWNRIHLPQLGLALTRAYALLPAWGDYFQNVIQNRPKGLRGNWRYIRENIYLCLVCAALQTGKIASSPEEIKTLDASGDRTNSADAS